ncbi:hypothetical protein K9L27_00085 [Candidatus Gracilibacteria bacterium]|nr:hypothetical protein [Candidatus Gracilibacteria bacterium]
MKKTCSTVIFLVLAFLGVFGGGAFAEKIKTVYLSPVDVRVEIKDSVMKADVWGKSLKPDQVKAIQKVSFQVIDNYDAEVFSQEIPWKQDFVISTSQGDNQVLIPFVHDFVKNDLSGIFELRVFLEDQRGKLIARGSRKFTLQKEESVTKIANLELKTEDQGSVNFVAFYEGTETQMVQPEITIRVQPQIDVFEHVSGGALVSSQKGKSQEIISNQKTNINVLFDVPKVPETYVIEARLLDENGKPITGTLRQRLFVDGDFGEIDYFETTPKRFLNAGDTVNISVAGMARRNQNPLTIKVVLDQLYRGQIQNTLSQEKQMVILSTPDFSEEFSFILPEPGASQLVAKVQLLRQGYLIEEKEFRTTEHLKYDSTAYKLYYGIMSDNLYLYVLGFIVIVGLIFWLVKSHKFSQIIGFFIIGCVLGGWGNVHAAWVNQWTYPQDGWAYNPTDTTGFEQIRFQGSVMDDGTSMGLFSVWGGIPSSITVDFYPESGGSSLATVNVDPATGVFSSENYAFELTIPGTLSDGFYTPQITFSKGGQLDVETSWEGNITMDITPPDLSFEYTPSSWTNQPVGVTITCENDLSGCYPSPVTPFFVTGNFCNDAQICNTVGARGFSVCDEVGNCSIPGNNKLIIDFFDPEPPQFDGFQLLRDIFSFGTGSSLEANETLDAEIQNPVDPEMTEIIFDTNACGPEIGNDIYFDGAECATRRVRCAVSAVEHGWYDRSAGELGCTFEVLPIQECSSFFFPLCIPFVTE